MTQIAVENGFPDLKTFNAMFKEQFHVSPAEYRKQYVGGIPEEGIRRLRRYDDLQIASVLERYVSESKENGF